MKVVMTLLVRDEADIIDAQLAFHLNAGVDLVIATDHRSRDGTTEILERYEREGYVRMRREESTGYHQAKWVSEMARLAATECGADWVINCDADEFWWPREGSLKEILAEVPRRYGVVRCFERHFAPRVDEAGHFAERMTLRVTPFAVETGPEDPFQTAMQVVHRADPNVVLKQGNHDVTSGGLVALRGWYPFEVFHFPLRTLEQARQKFEQKLTAIRAEPAVVGLHTLSAGRAIEEDRFDAWYASYVTEGSELERRLGAGEAVVDTRLRDVLRRLARVSSLPAPSSIEYALPGKEGGYLDFSRGGISEDARYASEMEPLDEWDSELRFLRRVEDLERRMAELDRGIGARVAARLRRLTAVRS